VACHWYVCIRSAVLSSNECVKICSARVLIYVASRRLKILSMVGWQVVHLDYAITCRSFSVVCSSIVIHDRALDQRLVELQGQQSRLRDDDWQEVKVQCSFLTLLITVRPAIINQRLGSRVSLFIQLTPPTSPREGVDQSTHSASPNLFHQYEALYGYISSFLPPNGIVAYSAGVAAMLIKKHSSHHQSCAGHYRTMWTDRLVGGLHLHLLLYIIPATPSSWLSLNFGTVYTEWMRITM